MKETLIDELQLVQPCCRAAINNPFAVNHLHTEIRLNPFPVDLCQPSRDEFLNLNSGERYIAGKRVDYRCIRCLRSCNAFINVFIFFRVVADLENISVTLTAEQETTIPRGNVM